jgi:hypothetical protein
MQTTSENGRVWHFYGKTKTAIISSKNQSRPQFWAQIACWRRDASVQPSFRSWQSFFGKVMRKTRFRKFSVGIYHTIKKKRNRHSYQDFPFCQTNSTITPVSIGSQLATFQNRADTSRGTTYWELPVRRAAALEISYCTLGRPNQIPDFTQ